MRRSVAIILAGVAAALAFAGLVYVVLVIAHVSEPAATTVYGLTARRAWATTAAVLALIGVAVGVLALVRPVRTSGSGTALAALAVGLVAAVNGALNVAVANGGPGTGNGVVGGAAALVLGLIAAAIGGLGLARSRRIALLSGGAT